MYCITIIAGTGQGKTTKAISIAKSQPDKGIFIFDYRGEPAYDNFSQDLNSSQCRALGIGPTKFLELCLHPKKKNTNIIIEEATIFLRGQAGENLRKILVSKRHNGHNIIFLYHSINAVPPEIFNMSDFIILGKTGDSEIQVKKKRPELITPFRLLKNKPKHSFINIKNF